MIHHRMMMIQLRLSADRGPEVPPKMAAGAGVEAGANQGLDLGRPRDQKAALDLEVTRSLRTDQSQDPSLDHDQDLIQDPNLAPGQSQDPNPDQILDQDPSQGPNQDPNQDPNRDLGQNLDPSHAQSPDLDPDLGLNLLPEAGLVQDL